MVKVKLTIAIPTFNRLDSLLSQVNNLAEQREKKYFEIVVIDNDTKSLNPSIEKKLTDLGVVLIKNPLNYGMGMNLCMPYTLKTTEWIWLLSDDDEMAENSVETILNKIDMESEACCAIKFSREGYTNPTSKARSIEDFIDFYHREKNLRHGDVVFYSTYVINASKLREFAPYAFVYSYTLIGFIIPILLCLNEKKLYLTFSDQCIVKYCPPKDGGWDYFFGAKCLSTIDHIDFKLSPKYHIKLYNLLFAVRIKPLIRRLVYDFKPQNLKDLNYVVTVYPGKSNFIFRLFIRIFTTLISFKQIRRIVKLIIKQGRK